MPNTNIELGNRAIVYVRGVVSASNRDADRAVVTNIDDKIMAMELEYMKTEQSLQDSMVVIKRWAELARNHEVGNCQVQASLAFDYLAKQQGRPKLELMSLNANGVWPEKINAAITGAEEEFYGPDHVFVVLDRVSGNIMDFKTWNFGAVICDPWAKRCYHAYELEGEMQLIRRVSGGSTRTVQMAELSAETPW